MKIKRIEFKNFKCFPEIIIPENEKQELSEGLILVQGATPERSNSFGKTSLVEGILFGLFGPKSTSLSINNLITFGQSEGELKITFEVDGIDYMAHRILRRNKTSGIQKLNTYYKKDRAWRVDTTIDIENLLEIKREQALETVFVKQGQIESLATATPAKLRDLIINLFRLDIVDYASEHLNKLGRAVIKHIKEMVIIPPDEIEKNIEKNRVRLAENEVDLGKDNVKLKELEINLKAFPRKEKLAELRTLKNNLENSRGNIEAFAEQIAKKSKILNINPKISESDMNKFIDNNTNAIVKIETEKKAISEELKGNRAQISKREGVISQIKNNIDEMNDNFDFNDKTLSAECPTCKREINFQTAQDIIWHYEEEIKSIKSKIEQFKPKISEFEKKSQDIEDKLDKVKLLGNKLQDFKEILGKIGELEKVIIANQDKYKKLLEEFKVTTEKEFLEKFKASNFDVIREKIAKIESEITRLTQKINDLIKNSKSLQEEIEELEMKKEEMIQLQEEKDKLEVKITYINKNKDLVKGFITEYMVEKRLIHNIQHVTKNFLNHFTGGQYSNLVLSSVDKGRGIGIEVLDEFSSTTKDLQFLSGGDKVALGFALRMGISELMTKIRPTKDSPKKNPKITFMILDEPLAALDKSRRAQVLTTLESQKNFNQIFLITHTNIPEEIKPNFIRISKNFVNGLSTGRFVYKERE